MQTTTSASPRLSVKLKFSSRKPATSLARFPRCYLESISMSSFIPFITGTLDYSYRTHSIRSMLTSVSSSRLASRLPSGRRRSETSRRNNFPPARGRRKPPSFLLHCIVLHSNVLCYITITPAIGYRLRRPCNTIQHPVILGVY